MWRSWQRWANHRGLSLVDLSIAEGKLTLHVRGADKLWAFKSSLEIPLVHIAVVRADPEAARGWYHGIRMPGTNVPGVITAGTFYQEGKRVFWDVHHPEKTIVINLHDGGVNERRQGGRYCLECHRTYARVHRAEQRRLAAQNCENVTLSNCEDVTCTEKQMRTNSVGAVQFSVQPSTD
jgi:hypothetical protein